MTTDPSPSGLHPISHLKAGPTTSSSKSTAVPGSSTTISPSQGSQRPQLPKNVSRDELNNATGDKATAALIRRVLCPQSGSHGGAISPYAPEEFLPPLTSSNDVDRQLYGLIAIIIKEFVSPWYSKITSDQTFINEVLQVVAHCSRALEQRLREIDITQLVLDELPALVEAHVAAYRMAKEQSHSSGLSPSSREIYHALNPHPALSPVLDTSDPESVSAQRENEAVYRRLLVKGVLAVLLPTEDLENACLRTLMNDILGDLILGDEVSGKVCQGWFLWASMTKLLEVLSRKDHLEPGDSSAGTVSSRKDQLRQFGLLSPPKNSESSHSSSTIKSRVTSGIWHILQYGFLVFVTLRFIVAGLLRVASTPPAIVTSRSSPPGSLVDEPLPKHDCIAKRPVLDYRLYGMLAQLFDVPRRMPWLGGLLALFQYLILAGPGKVGDSGSVLDRFLHETIHEYVLTPTLLPNLLLASREALFPHNTRPKPGASVNRIEALTATPTPTPPIPEGLQASTDNDTQATVASGGSPIRPVPPATTAGFSPLSPDQQQHPSTAEIASIRRKCAVGILSLMPRPIARRLFGISVENSLGEILTPAQAPHVSQGPEPRLDYQCSLSSELASSNGSLCGDAEEMLLLSAIENDILDLFADEYCNKHLIYSIIESVLARLLPELSDRSIGELMEDRGFFLAAG
ncbi:PXA domain-containing protein [Aspergillus lucknowensis]|uniref:PXA domain-containing protein n=1 Tax=Aspergillus lucknowensis TaxID=176173 RepID=A0ABR4M3F2_9EURO